MSGYVYGSNGEPLANERGEIFLAHARAERTCYIVETYYDAMWDAVCWQLSCGHDTWSDEPKFCPKCGAKVIK